MITQSDAISTIQCENEHFWEMDQFYRPPTDCNPLLNGCFKVNRECLRQKKKY